MCVSGLNPLVARRRHRKWEGLGRVSPDPGCRGLGAKGVGSWGIGRRCNPQTLAGRGRVTHSLACEIRRSVAAGGRMMDCLRAARGQFWFRQGAYNIPGLSLPHTKRPVSSWVAALPNRRRTEFERAPHTRTVPSWPPPATSVQVAQTLGYPFRGRGPHAPSPTAQTAKTVSQ